MNNKDEELFKYLIIKHCNDLNRYMPFMFETIDDYTEILFPEGLLGTNAFVHELTNTEILPEDNWRKVEVIGWLYQYYISEENERVIQAKKRYKAEELPFATQLFTPEWIVRYMVQNALGRYWIESHPEDHDLVENWEFYLENQNVDPTFKENLALYANKKLNIEEIKCFDPAMGSGHILVYMFDVLYEIYSKAGYIEREIPRLIIENNLYGLDIDIRSYQLASFSVVMKALEYNKRFLQSIELEGLKMNLAALQETNSLTDEEITFLANESLGENYENMKDFIEQFHHAKSIGSLIKLKSFDKEWLNQRMKEMEEQYGNLFEMDMRNRLVPLFASLIKQGSIMARQYDIFITNPPYAGNKYVTTEVSNYLAKNYPEVKSDLFSAFIEYSFFATKENGQIGFMSPFVWMFISSFEKLRDNIITNRTLSSLIQLEYSGFDGATVPICTFTLRNYHSGFEGEYIKLSDFKGSLNQPIKVIEAVSNPSVSYRSSFDQDNFSKIPGSPIAYWVSEETIKVFEKNDSLGNIIEAKQGCATANNNKYLRLWYECNFNNIGFNIGSRQESKESGKMWFPYNKGGAYRKWYGNQEYVIKWGNDGEEIFNDKKAVVRNPGYYFKESVSWSDITSSSSAFRFYEKGFIFDSTGHCCFANEEVDVYQILAICNNKFFDSIIKMLNPTLHFHVGYFKNLPGAILNDNESKEIVKQNIQISKSDWNSKETSWKFEKNSLIKFPSKTMESSFIYWENFTIKQFNQLKSNEEELNRIFIEAYNLKNDMNSEVEEKNVTINRAEFKKEIKNFISYAIGCSFGRYSLDEEGLIYAGGKFDSSRYRKFLVDEDNILPMLSRSYFEDDIVARFIEFVRVTYSEDVLEENLNFVTKALGRRSNETVREALRRYFLNDFYKDHLQVYKKRPIYWLFTSGKEKAFNCLVYMHRYDKTTLSRIRTDYLHEVQIRMDSEKKDLLNIINGDSSTKEISDAKKELKVLDKKIDELKAYDEKLHHMADMQIEIDLDDGVVVNYAKFEGLVAKI
ncbi:BREX-1 system adenine-specific DNA-methyltransferase PglX [Planococcus kocurii]|uniref:BREX-1 system adenine-specific DNA-methyltransferase PglX n=1 Tax=Planococcus kocurii TaxID=1374 RepID=UPI001F012869|nr:BREX-1 system adenine-specific DNA-methyltransferase PglX [Planococcus kocurii]